MRAEDLVGQYNSGRSYCKAIGCRFNSPSPSYVLSHVRHFHPMLLRDDRSSSLAHRNNRHQTSTVDFASASHHRNITNLDSVIVELNRLSNSDYRNLSKNLLRHGHADVKLSSDNVEKMLRLCHAHAKSDGPYGNKIYHITDKEFVAAITKVANSIHQPIASQLNYSNGHLKAHTLELKTWGPFSAEDFHQDRPDYPLVMGITLSDDEQMQYISRSHMGHIQKTKDNVAPVFSPKSTFRENSHISHAQKYNLVIFHSRNDNSPPDKPSLVHRSPPNSQGRTIGLFRFSQG